MSESKGDNRTLSQMTAEITEAFVANNTLPPDQVSTLIRDVHNSIKHVVEGGEQQSNTREPAVAVRRAVKKDHIVCLECGKKLKVLKRHLNAVHGLTPAEYRERWGLSAAFPLVAPDYASKRSQLAKDMGLGNQQRRE